MLLPRATALTAVLCVVSACATTEGPRLDTASGPTSGPRAGTPGWRWSTLGESVDRPVSDGESEPRWQWMVDAGPADGGVEGTPLPGGLSVAVRNDAPSRRVETASIEAGRPHRFPVGRAPWLGDGGGAAGPVTQGRVVRIAWQVCLRARGTCSVEVEAVPVLIDDADEETPLEAWRVRRTLALDEALVVGTDPARQPTDAASLVVGSPGRPGRFVVRVRS
ncbi:MAG: hypothetical protein IT460_09900 [Planctomycetes bacterium]|nr:hypothetical protein [Planctomycetota bacterium]